MFAYVCVRGVLKNPMCIPHPKIQSPLPNLYRPLQVHILRMTTREFCPCRNESPEFFHHNWTKPSLTLTTATTRCRKTYPKKELYARTCTHLMQKYCQLQFTKYNFVFCTRFHKRIGSYGHLSIMLSLVISS